jgi:hypothetical protein
MAATAEKPDYSINKKTYSKNNSSIGCSIEYPEISGLEDMTQQNLINDVIKDEAVKVMNYYPNAGGFLNIQISYEIKMQSKELLSICYSGECYEQKAPFPINRFYTTNINILKGDKITLNDCIEIDAGFIDKFVNKDHALNPEQGEALEYFSKDELLEYLSHSDNMDNIGSHEESGVFCYLTSDSLGISLFVGHTFRDHMEFEVKYDCNSRVNAKT